MSEVVCVWRRIKGHKVMVVKQSFVGEKMVCPKCHCMDSVYIHLDHKEEDPINPKYWCVACHHEWDEKEDRLGHND